MALLGPFRNADRIKAIAPVVAIHAALGYALVYGLVASSPEQASERLKLFDVLVEPPPPITEQPADIASPEPEGAAAPPSLPPTPVVAPTPEIPVPAKPPIVAAPTPGTGSATSEGTADRAGTGTGSGGVGTGSGSGGAGTGTGGGGSPAVRVRGGISNSDYPSSAKRAGIEGTVYVRFTVAPSGSVRGCQVTRSSGNAALDSTTCRLIERRFRYRPATDARGRPVESVQSTSFQWYLGR